MSQITAADLLSLARQSLDATLKGQADSQFPKLVEGLDEAITRGMDIGYALARARQESPQLDQYLRRVMRTVAAEDEVPAATDTWRLVLCGVGLLLPPGFDFHAENWSKAIAGLETGLQAMWADDAYQVSVMPEASPLDSLYRLSPTEVRGGLLALFADRWTDHFHLGEAAPENAWSAWVLPVVVALDVDAARGFSASVQSPRAPTPKLSGIKHRFESQFEGAGQTPMFLPPVGWANLFSFVRGMLFRKTARVLVAAHPEAKSDWTVKFDAPSLQLTNFRARVAQEFWFPEETAGDVKQMVAPAASQLGIKFVGADDT